MTPRSIVSLQATMSAHPQSALDDAFQSTERMQRIRRLATEGMAARG